MTATATAPVMHPTAAPSSPIATAARAFGDDYPPVHDQWRVRAAGLVLLAITVMYVPWMLTSLNTDARWLAWPFAAANLFSVFYSAVIVINSWERRVPARRPVRVGGEQPVAVIIPTCGESVPMVLRTVTSVLAQDWPIDRLIVVVSDDGHDRALEVALIGMPVLYHSPPPRFAPGRDGAAKAGNLNSALAMLDAEHPEIVYIETRDADDELGSNGFLRQVVGQLEVDNQLAYVQTIKEAQVSAGDPFNNRESGFYRGQMLARNAANAVFPCGSGVVWRRTAL
ncbi:MAG TPA: glycosyltransferase, partial [Acidimicrobiales bacterium]|nr:glycosyltransferase [Acidimicrobiales bacterium]